jgi:hypothetical protein
MSEGGQKYPTNYKKKANWIGHILHRNCLLKYVTEGKIGVRIRRGRRCEKLLDEHKKKIGYCELKEEAQDRAMWRTHFNIDYGSVVRRTTELMNE